MSDQPDPTPGTKLGIDDFGWPLYAEIIATWQPKRRDDLRPEMEPFIGQRTGWTFAGRQDSEQKFPGQVTWMPIDRSWPGLWVPDEDLTDAAPIRKTGEASK